MDDDDDDDDDDYQPLIEDSKENENVEEGNVPSNIKKTDLDETIISENPKCPPNSLENYPSDCDGNITKGESLIISYTSITLNNNPLFLI